MTIHDIAFFSDSSGEFAPSLTSSSQPKDVFPRRTTPNEDVFP